jgi:hypothetical protein
MPVAEAYRMLADEGWLDLKHRRGALLIARPTTLRLAPEVEGRFVQRLVGQQKCDWWKNVAVVSGENVAWVSLRRFANTGFRLCLYNSVPQEAANRGCVS